MASLTASTSSEQFGCPAKNLRAWNRIDTPRLDRRGKRRFIHMRTVRNHCPPLRHHQRRIDSGRQIEHHQDRTDELRSVR